MQLCWKGRGQDKEKHEEKKSPRTSNFILGNQRVVSVRNRTALECFLSSVPEETCSWRFCLHSLKDFRSYAWLAQRCLRKSFAQKPSTMLNSSTSTELWHTIEKPTKVHSDVEAALPSDDQICWLKFMKSQGTGAPITTDHEHQAVCYLCTKPYIWLSVHPSSHPKRIKYLPAN